MKKKILLNNFKDCTIIARINQGRKFTRICRKQNPALMPIIAKNFAAYHQFYVF